MNEPIELLLRDILPVESAHSFHVQEVAGGDICRSFLVTLNEGQQFFVKTGATVFYDIFQAEQRGLQELAKCPQFKVPTPLGTHQNDVMALLVMEALHFAHAGERGQAALGHALAQLHHVQAKQHGFEQDNFIGRTPQKNSWHSDWVEFWLTCRMQPQLNLLKQNGASSHFMKIADQFCRLLPSLLSDHQPEPVLLHGDLWSGNYGILQGDRPSLFDPAVYYGDRETDIAMTHLFGGFSKSFYDAYHEVWPIDDNFAERKTIYNLYHLLNHANLFGGGYLMQAQREMQRFL